MAERRRPIKQLLRNAYPALHDRGGDRGFDAAEFLYDHVTRHPLHRAEDILSRTRPDEGPPDWGPIARDDEGDPIPNENINDQILWMGHLLAQDVTEQLQGRAVVLLLEEHETYVLQSYMADYHHIFPFEEYEPEWADEIIELANDILRADGPDSVPDELWEELTFITHGGKPTLLPKATVFLEEGAIYAQYELDIENLQQLVCASWGHNVNTMFETANRRAHRMSVSYYLTVGRSTVNVGPVMSAISHQWREIRKFVNQEDPTSALELLWNIWSNLNELTVDSESPESRFGDGVFQWDFDVMMLIVEKCIFALNWYIRNDKEDSVSREFIKVARDFFLDPFHVMTCRELGIDGMVLDPPFGTPYNWDDVKDG